MTAGSCWAQPTAKAGEGASGTAAQASASKESKGKQSAKSSSKTTKVAKSAQTKQDSSKSKHSGKSADKPVAEKADKPDAPVAADKTQAKSTDKVEARAPDLTPPPGTMMGAYGQSLMRTAALSSVAGGAAVVLPQPTAAMNAQAGTLSSGTPALASLAAAQNTPAGTTSITAANTMMAAAAPALPATAMMGAAGATSNDAVNRFLKQQGIVAQATAQTQAENAAMAGNPSLLNEVRDRASNLVLSAMNFLGVPYRRGGNSVSNGFDCSGFTRHIFEMSVGLVLPRRADEQAKMSQLISIKKEDLKPGDLVFFNTMRATFSHVGIYVGEGKFIHSPRAGGAVRVEDMRESYWAKRFTGARRADLAQAPNT
ncbi:NlpC/P60 family protein [Roseateles terrae]|uniref:Cell wall-associated NlpC family hydrolase n=1 Tax=Roseateles terrae TaxID=431060 RepID=A0ABR6GPI0_9BURK|nr:NlpC/P60 family protein [Roseateles terrae]MBB3193602.1 cell wall-associated NlpC family hydrolase [Roseateles terrae]